MQLQIKDRSKIHTQLISGEPSYRWYTLELLWFFFHNSLTKLQNHLGKGIQSHVYNGYICIGENLKTIVKLLNYLNKKF